MFPYLIIKTSHILKSQYFVKPSKVKFYKPSYIVNPRHHFLSNFFHFFLMSCDAEDIMLAIEEDQQDCSYNRANP